MSIVCVELLNNQYAPILKNAPKKAQHIEKLASWALLSLKIFSSRNNYSYKLGNVLNWDKTNISKFPVASYKQMFYPTCTNLYPRPTHKFSKSLKLCRCLNEDFVFTQRKKSSLYHLNCRIWIAFSGFKKLPSNPLTA